ncbi:hypothetical protein EDB83DRAFT_2401649 [Lactarius deliciosus]|nr:hypothetical protein EDB83DRAFT_2401649 [Lactarius deliciosus]
MAEIGASRRIWPEAKHQLSVYNAQRAIHEHTFISPTFKPYGRADPNDSEDPNSLKIRIPAINCDPTLAGSHPDSPEVPTEHLVAGASGPTHTGGRLSSIRIPVLAFPCGTGFELRDQEHLPTLQDSPSEFPPFCPIEHRDVVVEMMKRHFCAHPLIPGYSAPSPEGIKAWALGELVSTWEVGAVGAKWGPKGNTTRLT